MHLSQKWQFQIINNIRLRRLNKVFFHVKKIKNQNPSYSMMLRQLISTDRFLHQYELWLTVCSQFIVLQSLDN